MFQLCYDFIFLGHFKFRFLTFAKGGKGSSALFG